MTGLCYHGYNFYHKHPIKFLQYYRIYRERNCLASSDNNNDGVNLHFVYIYFLLRHSLNKNIVVYYKLMFQIPKHFFYVGIITAKMLASQVTQYLSNHKKYCIFIFIHFPQLLPTYVIVLWLGSTHSCWHTKQSNKMLIYPACLQCLLLFQILL